MAMPVDVTGGIAGKLPLPIMELAVLLLCWSWFANGNIGMTANEGGSGSILAQL